jgi:hypothetical protein
MKDDASSGSRAETETEGKTFTNTEECHGRTMFWTIYENFRNY